VIEEEPGLKVVLTMFRLSPPVCRLPAAPTMLPAAF